MNRYRIITPPMAIGFKLCIKQGMSFIDKKAIMHAEGELITKPDGRQYIKMDDGFDCKVLEGSVLKNIMAERVANNLDMI
jgi:hypothetical protein